MERIELKIQDHERVAIIDGHERETSLITFSDITPFGNVRHYAVQVKAGDVRGGAASQVDDIIGQLDDAFSMPYFDITSDAPCYISTFIIAISGRFTKNAKAKVAHKMRRGLYGSVWFLDRERILELVERWWWGKEIRPLGARQPDCGDPLANTFPQDDT